MKKQAKVKQLTLKQRVDKAFERINAQADRAAVFGERLKAFHERLKKIEGAPEVAASLAQELCRLGDTLGDRITEVEKKLSHQMAASGHQLASKAEEAVDARFVKVSEFVNNSKRGQEERIKEVERKIKEAVSVQTTGFEERLKKLEVSAETPNLSEKLRLLAAYLEK